MRCEDLKRRADEEAARPGWHARLALGFVLHVQRDETWLALQTGR